MAIEFIFSVNSSTKSHLFFYQTMAHFSNINLKYKRNVKITIGERSVLFLNTSIENNKNTLWLGVKCVLFNLHVSKNKRHYEWWLLYFSLASIKSVYTSKRGNWNGP